MKLRPCGEGHEGKSDDDGDDDYVKILYIDITPTRGRVYKKHPKPQTRKSKIEAPSPKPKASITESTGLDAIAETTGALAGNGCGIRVFVAWGFN